ncbi:hypothetical protein [Saccharothrix deserti]|uniref:hypothetical protein n=1 Tax=Saccharothrix deserti TaxID=2593674 RepID=UPI00131B425C|nr:hypothetical protein [Saccharothrix deserti]
MRRQVVLVLAGLVLAGCGARGADVADSHPVLTDSASATSEARMPVKLSPQGKDVLQQAKRSGAKTVVLTVSTERDKTDQVAAGLQQLGATVEATDTTIGYVRVSVPVELAEKATTVEGISRVDVDEPLSNIDPTP